MPRASSARSRGRGSTRGHDPAGTPAITISSLNLAAYPTWAPDLAPGLSSVFGGQVVWSPYSQQELAGITYEDQQHFMTDARLTKTDAWLLARADVILVEMRRDDVIQLGLGFTEEGSNVAGHPFAGLALKLKETAGSTTGGSSAGRTVAP